MIKWLKSEMEIPVYMYLTAVFGSSLCWFLYPSAKELQKEFGVILIPRDQRFSSTKIRERINYSQSIKGLTLKNISGYIHKNNLYKPREGSSAWESVRLKSIRNFVSDTCLSRVQIPPFPPVERLKVCFNYSNVIGDEFT